MIAFILRRLLQSIAVLLAVGLVAFSLFRYVGDPINAMVGQDTSMEDWALLREKLGLNDSPFVQFLRFVSNAARGNFGLSYRIFEPVGMAGYHFGVGRALRHEDRLLELRDERRRVELQPALEPRCIRLAPDFRRHTFPPASGEQAASTDLDRRQHGRRAAAGGPIR